MSAEVKQVRRAASEKSGMTYKFDINVRICHLEDMGEGVYAALSLYIYIHEISSLRPFRLKPSGLLDFLLRALWALWAKEV